MTSLPSSGWTLYSPATPSDIEAPAWGKHLGVTARDKALDGFHEGGWFLSETAKDGWIFGVSQERLCTGRVHAFLRTPSSEELTVVLDPRATGVSHLEVPPDTGYLGAVLVGLSQVLGSRQSLVSALQLPSGTTEACTCSVAAHRRLRKVCKTPGRSA
jgi:hypothetical protein